MLEDPHRAKAQRLRQAVLQSQAHTSLESRQAAAANTNDGTPLLAYAAQVHRDAVRVTDEQVAALKQTHSEDALFEITVAAATGAGFARLDKLLAALEERP